MVQGTASHVGKSLLAAALCRIFAREGLRVAPFKSQNMALNSFVTPDGGEIGRAQALQALAAGIEPTVEMNPILLKPNSETGSQVVVLGKPVGNMRVREYHDYQRRGMEIALGALHSLRARFDLVVIEGAGSPAEINLRDRDIANMAIAKAAGAPVLLLADIERGGVFASIVGTMELLLPEERALVCGHLINKFRGDVSLLDSGLDFLRERTGVPVLGVLPYLRDLRIAEEDSLGLESRQDPRAGDLRVAVVRLPHLSNYTDFLPLEAEPGVSVRYAERSVGLSDAHVVILPGTKSTLSDLDWLHRSGMARAVAAAADRGAWVIGICGGYQMLGRHLLDPEAIESSETTAEGLGLLPVDTRFGRKKTLTRVQAVCALPWAGNATAEGYEIHQGQSARTAAAESAGPAFRLSDGGGERADGASHADGRIFGTYLHGLFDADAFRHAFLTAVRADLGQQHEAGAAFDPLQELDRLADAVVQHVDLATIRKAVGLE